MEILIYTMVRDIRKRILISLLTIDKVPQARGAQEKLGELEKASAPFHEQILEAARFLSVDIGRITNYSGIGENDRGSGKLHGREEWVLRWLLKKLQAAGADGTRSAASQIQFCAILANKCAAPDKILKHGDFLHILRRYYPPRYRLVSLMNGS